MAGEAMSESMFYVLMALQGRARCGTEIARFIEDQTGGRIRMGPGTLYTILGRLEKGKFIMETEVEGRKRSYCLTEQGIALYRAELGRLKACVLDAEREEKRVCRDM